MGTARERNRRDAAALVKGNKLLEVVEIGEHLLKRELRVIQLAKFGHTPAGK